MRLICTSQSARMRTGNLGPGLRARITNPGQTLSRLQSGFVLGTVQTPGRLPAGFPWFAGRKIAATFRFVRVSLVLTVTLPWNACFESLQVYSVLPRWISNARVHIPFALTRGYSRGRFQQAWSQFGLGERRTSGEFYQRRTPQTHFSSTEY